MKQLCSLFLILLLTACGGGNKSDVRDNPEESFAHHYNLGLAALENQNYSKAIGHFEDSLRLNPNIPRTHNELGLCYLYLGQLNNAIASLETAISLNPNMPEAHNSLGVAHMRLGNAREAEKHWNAALATRDYQTPFIPLYNLGLMYAEQGNDRYAMEKFQQALKNEDQVSLDYRIYINYQIGGIHYRQGNYKEAIDYFEKVLVLNPKMIDAAFKAGVSAMKLNNPELARVMFDRVILNAPGTELAEQAREYLNTMD